MSKKFYTVADIAKSTGYNRSTITRWLAKHKIKNAQMKGNAPLYSAQVLEDFKKAHDNRDTKPDAKEALMQVIYACILVNSGYQISDNQELGYMEVNVALYIYLDIQQLHKE